MISRCHDRKSVSSHKEAAETYIVPLNSIFLALELKTSFFTLTLKIAQPIIQGFREIGRVIQCK